jgi:glycosyltransferase involved in cell wall biosynthesis
VGLADVRVLARALEHRGVSQGDAQRPCLVFVVTEDWYFMSHRIGLARCARAAGWRVVVAARESDRAAAIRAEGLEFIALPFERALTYPWRDLRLLWALRGVLRTVSPDLVHLVSLKPILLGGLALRLSGRPCPALLAFTGLGYIFSSRAGLARLLKPVIMRLLAWVARGPGAWVLAQNEDDLALLRANGIADGARASIIAGAGLDVSEFPVTPLPPRAGALVILPARVLRDKGVYEFVAAATRVRALRTDVRFALVGAHDRANPGAVDGRDLERWVATGAVEWWGHRRDMAAVYVQAYVVCLPSYREGLPRALLEAAACGRPLIATDVPGCREICMDGETGLRVPAQDVEALVQAVLRMLDTPALAAACAQAARAKVEREFTLEHIADETLALYRQLSAAS